MMIYSSTTIGLCRNNKVLKDGLFLSSGLCPYAQFTEGRREAEASAKIFVQRKKKVRFADDEGGLLCSVKIFEESPFVYQPRLHNKSVFSKNKLTNYTVTYNETKLFLKQLCVVAYGLLDDTTLFGAIAVRNISFEKTIFIRMTLDGWKTSEDIPAKFVQQEYNGHVDRFFFTKKIDGEFNSIAQNTEFAVCFVVKGDEHWDNNGGENFKFAK